MDSKKNLKPQATNDMPEVIADLERIPVPVRERLVDMIAGAALVSEADQRKSA